MSNSNVYTKSIFVKNIIKVNHFMDLFSMKKLVEKKCKDDRY